jgi:hypothetical protein
MQRSSSQPRLDVESEGQGSPWDVDVDVYLRPDGEEPPFKMQSCLPRNPDGEFVFDNCGRHGFQIHFHLKDPHKTGYLFPRSAQLREALWSWPRPECPPENHGEQWREFKAVRVSPDGKTLVVRNLNETETKFGYTLRVTKDGGDSYRDLDPIGENKNGSF